MFYFCHNFFRHMFESGRYYVFHMIIGPVNNIYIKKVVKWRGHIGQRPVNLNCLLIKSVIVGK